MALDEAARAARAERIKQLREESRYTQPHIAEFVGVSLRAYQRWEEGGGIEWEHLEKLAELHEVDPQWIHRGSEKGPAPDPFASESAATADELLAEIRSLRLELLAEIAKVHTALEAQRQHRGSDGRGKAANDS